MLTFLAILHVCIGLALILFVLLQDPKGGAMGVFSGGSSSSSFFGASGASNFLTKSTRWLAVLFAVSCLTLTYLTAKRGGSVMDSYVPPAAAPGVAAPAAPAAAESSAAPTATPPAAQPETPAKQ